MFNNVVSTQDLLSDSQRSSYSNDSALFSLSQRQHSQSDFSQVRTQDMFSQKLTGSQSENSFPAGKKMSMYEKWMSKGSLFKRDPPKGTQPTGTTSQFSRSDSMSYQQATRKDDRDQLLQQVVTIIQDCNKEVQSTLGAVKDTLNSRNEASTEKTNEMLKAFLEDIWKHEDRMLHAVEESNTTSSRIMELEKQLAVKEAEIQQLQKQVKGQDKQDVKLVDKEDVKMVAKAVRQELWSPQAAVENKLQEILDVTRETSEQQSRQLDQYKQQMTTYTKKHNELKTANQKLLKETEKRLQKEINSLRTALQQQEEDWQSKLHDQLSEAHTSHTHNIEQLLDQVLTQTSSRAAAGNRQGQDSAVHAAISSLKKELHSVLQKQEKTVERRVQDLLSQQLQCQQEQLQELQTSLMADVASCVQSTLEQQREDAVTPLTLPLFEEKFEEYHKDVKQQLQDLHHKHVQEVLRLQQELKNPDSSLMTSSGSGLKPFTLIQYDSKTTVQPEKSMDQPLKQTAAHFQRNVGVAGMSTATAASATMACKPFPGVRPAKGDTKSVVQQDKTDHCFGRKTYNPRPPGYQLARISPLSKQERASLFSTHRASPVMAVLPQKQPATLTGRGDCVNRDSQQLSSSTNKQEGKVLSVRGQRPPATAVKEKETPPAQRKKRKPAPRNQGKKNTGKKPKCDKKTARSPRVLRGRDSAHKMAVYDFSDAGSPVATQRMCNLFTSKQSQICSPDPASDASHLSSPAVSITEVVVVRRSRWQNKSCVPQQSASTGMQDTLDILSTPCLQNQPASQLVQQNQESIETKRELRRGTSKRKQ